MTAQDWFDALTPPQRQIALPLRRLILETAPLREDLKWGQPCYLGASMVCYLQRAKGHVSLGFGQGAKLSDPKGVLQGAGSQMRHVRIALGTKPDREALSHLIAQAVALDQR